MKDIFQNSEQITRLIQTNSEFKQKIEETDAIIEQMEDNIQSNRQFTTDANFQNAIRFTIQSLADLNIHSEFMTLRLQKLVNSLDPRYFKFFDLMEPIPFVEDFTNLKQDMKEKGYQIPLSMIHLNLLPTILGFDPSTSQISIILQIPLKKNNQSMVTTQLVTRPQITIKGISLILHEKYMDQMLVKEPAEGSHFIISKQQFEERALKIRHNNEEFYILLHNPVFHKTSASCLMSLNEAKKDKVMEQCSFKPINELIIQTTDNGFYITTFHSMIQLNFVNLNEVPRDPVGVLSLIPNTSYLIQLNNGIVAISDQFQYQNQGGHFNKTSHHQFMSADYKKLNSLLGDDIIDINPFNAASVFTSNAHGLTIRGLRRALESKQNIEDMKSHHTWSFIIGMALGAATLISTLYLSITLYCKHRKVSRNMIHNYQKQYLNAEAINTHGDRLQDLEKMVEIMNPSDTAPTLQTQTGSLK